MFEKTEKAGVLKDKHSGALINNDINKLEAYKKQKAVLRESSNATKKIVELEKEIKFVKEELFKIRKVLKETQQMEEL